MESWYLNRCRPSISSVARGWFSLHVQFSGIAAADGSHRPGGLFSAAPEHSLIDVLQVVDAELPGRGVQGLVARLARDDGSEALPANTPASLGIDANTAREASIVFSLQNGVELRYSVVAGRTNSETPEDGADAEPVPAWIWG